MYVLYLFSFGIYSKCTLWYLLVPSFSWSQQHTFLFSPRRSHYVLTRTLYLYLFRGNLFRVYLEGRSALGSALGKVRCTNRISSRVEPEVLLLNILFWLHPFLISPRGKVLDVAGISHLMWGCFTCSCVSHLLHCRMSTVSRDYP